MKKIITIALLIIIVVMGGAIIFSNQEIIDKEYKIADGKIRMKVPARYTIVGEDGELNLYDEREDISIKVGNLEADFWSSEDLNERIEEYIKILSSANYDASIKNVKIETLEQSEGKIGRVQVDLEKQTSSRRTITLITANIEPNTIIEIRGTTNAMEENNEEIEEIVSSIKIKK